MMHSPTMIAWKALLGRIALSAVFIMSGASKLFMFDSNVAFAQSVNMPMPEVGIAIAIAIELLGGLMVLFGWHTRLAAKAFIVFILVANFFFHMDWSDQMQMVMFMKNLALLGGFLLLIAHGPGPYSIDGMKKSAPQQVA